MKENAVDRKARLRYEASKFAGGDEKWASKTMVDLKAHYRNKEGQIKLKITNFNTQRIAKDLETQNFPVNM